MCGFRIDAGLIRSNRISIDFPNGLRCSIAKVVGCLSNWQCKWMQSNEVHSIKRSSHKSSEDHQLEIEFQRPKNDRQRLTYLLSGKTGQPKQSNQNCPRKQQNEKPKLQEELANRKSQWAKDRMAENQRNEHTVSKAKKGHGIFSQQIYMLKWKKKKFASEHTLPDTGKILSKLTFVLPKMILSK